ncbi:MAG: translation initiation factor IF-2 [Parachlamydiaceae bacterium]|nr:translation initiation factor IF-2 [Parachlamydiaceae bacterium]
MAKNLKLNIKNTQIAEAVNLSGLKSKLAKKKAESEEEAKKAPSDKGVAKSTKIEKEELPKEEAPRIRARSKSAFAEPHGEFPISKEGIDTQEEPNIPETVAPETTAPFSLKAEDDTVRTRTSAEIRKDIFGDEEPQQKTSFKQILNPLSEEKSTIEMTATIPTPITKEKVEITSFKEKEIPSPIPSQQRQAAAPAPVVATPYEKLGPTGKHMRDYVRAKPPARPPAPSNAPAITSRAGPAQSPAAKAEEARDKLKPKVKGKTDEAPVSNDDDAFKKTGKAKFKEFRDIKPTKKPETRQFDARDRQGLRTSDEERWRKQRNKGMRLQQEEVVVRPTSLKIRTPISIKDLASEMKLKASQLIGKLFLQGVVVTLNDLLEDETTIQLLGQEFGCELTIDRTEERRIRITENTIREELQKTDPSLLIPRPPVVAFMGHVDHGKTSLIDSIRKSNRAAGEAGAITQHIGAFRCSTPVGDITVLDTPGHEAFSAMRARGADVTDIVVLVVAGDEGLRMQSIEAIQHAKAAKVTIVVAINKSDKPNFNADNVYRQLAEQDLLPESWGGQTITVNCSAVNGQGIKELLEMLALQAEVLELNANPESRARGTVIESELHKGLGSVASVLVQNGTLRRGDSLVFGEHWGRVKTMQDEYGRELESAGPSTPVEITGLSGLPDAGHEFIVVKNEKEAREISEVRSEGIRQTTMIQKKKVTMENLFQQASDSGRKMLNIVLRADVQGSLEALKAALMKIHSDKADLNIIFAGVGEVSESDIQLAAASKAVVIGFHTQIESHAEAYVKQLGIQVRMHDIIYHAIDDVKLLMAGLLDKIAVETEKGKAVVKATFKSSHTGVIAGCQVTEGSIMRNNHVRVRRGQDVVWTGTISSLKRVKEDVREVQKGMECGILLNNFSDIVEFDVIEAYDVTYISQEL